MKKLTALILALVFILGLTACNKPEAIEDVNHTITDNANNERIENSIESSENDRHTQAKTISPAISLGAAYELKELPEGYSIDVLSERCLLFLKNQQPVAGLDIIKIPEGTYDPSDPNWIWLEEAELSDFRSEIVQYIGGTTDGKNGWIAEFASEEPEGHPGHIHRRHVYHIIENNLYDVWFELNLLADDEAEKLENVVQFAEE